MRRSSLSRALALVALLGACAPMQWEKKDASAEQLERDLRECQDAAYLEAQRPTGVPRMGPAALTPPSDRRFNTYPYGPFADPYGDQFAEELRLSNACMRQRGYELAPAKKN